MCTSAPASAAVLVPVESASDAEAVEATSGVHTDGSVARSVTRGNVDGGSCGGGVGSGCDGATDENLSISSQMTSLLESMEASVRQLANIPGAD